MKKTLEYILIDNYGGYTAETYGKLIKALYDIGSLTGIDVNDMVDSLDKIDSEEI